MRKERFFCLSCNPGCKHYSWRWNVSVIPLILLNVRCASTLLGCVSAFATEGMFEVEEVITGLWGWMNGLSTFLCDRWNLSRSRPLLPISPASVTLASMNVFRMINLQNGKFFPCCLVGFEKKILVFISSFINGACGFCVWFLYDYLFSFSGSLSCFFISEQFLCLLSVINEVVTRSYRKPGKTVIVASLSSTSALELSFYFAITYTALLKYIFLNLCVNGISLQGHISV